MRKLLFRLVVALACVVYDCDNLCAVYGLWIGGALLARNYKLDEIFSLLCIERRRLENGRAGRLYTPLTLHGIGGGASSLPGIEAAAAVHLRVVGWVEGFVATVNQPALPPAAVIAWVRVARDEVGVRRRLEDVGILLVMGEQPVDLLGIGLGLGLELGLGLR